MRITDEEMKRLLDRAAEMGRLEESVTWLYDRSEYEQVELLEKMVKSLKETQDGELKKLRKTPAKLTDAPDLDAWKKELDSWKSDLLKRVDAIPLYMAVKDTRAIISSLQQTIAVMRDLIEGL